MIRANCHRCDERAIVRHHEPKDQWLCDGCTQIYEQKAYEEMLAREEAEHEEMIRLLRI